MSGYKKNWVLSLLIDSSKNEINDMNRINFNFLSWSQYDRVNIIEVDTFKDLCTKSASVNLSGAKWSGTERNLHLVPDEILYESNFTWVLLESNPLIKINKESTKDYGLYTILTLRYDDNISLYKNNISFKELSQIIRKNTYIFLDEFILSNYADKLVYYPFLSLDSEDLVLIFLSDELESVYQCIEFVKTITYFDNANSEKSVYSSLSVFPGFNIADYKSNPNVDAIVKVCLRSNVNAFGFLKQIKEYCKTQEINYVDRIYLRNSCIYFELVSNENIFLLYHVDGLLNGIQSFYKENIKSSRTYWVKKNQFKDIERINIEYPESQISSINWDRYSITKKYNNEESETPVKNKVAQFILSEYDRLINTPRCIAWLPILTEQEVGIRKYVKALENINDNDTLCSFLNYCQTSLTYINQACSPIYEIPYHNYYYQGSFNDILKMYYGIISSILKIGKTFHHETKRLNKITFAVNFEAATKIHSIQYTFEGEQLVFFHIPYENFYDYTLTIPALIHEVFHYVLPYSNKNCNTILLSLIISKIMNEIKSIVFGKMVDIDELSEKIINEYWNKKFNELNELIIEYVNQSVPIYFDLTTAQLKSILVNDRESFGAVYKAIINYVCDFVKNDFLYNKSDEAYIKVLSEFSELTVEDIDTVFLFNQLIDRDLFVFINDILSGTKEAFCDIFITKILNISFEEYIKLLFNILCRTSNLTDLENYLMDCGFYSSVSMFETLIIRVSILINYFYRKEIKEDGLNTTIDIWFLNKISIIKVADNERVFELFKNFLIDRYNSYQDVYGDYNERINIMAIEGVEEWSIEDYPELIEIRDNLKDFCFSPDDAISIDLMTNFIYFYDNSVSESVVADQVNTLKINYRFLKIQSLEEYIKAVRKILTLHGSKDKLWFRGVCNNAYKLTPSLFRNIDFNLSLYTNQANILKTAYEKTLSYNEIWSQSIAEQMALLQHYGIATNLLDFSLDMLVALHFALNPDFQDDKDNIDSGKFTPVVYIFDPVVYSKAVTELKKGKVFDGGSVSISPIVYDIDNSSEIDEFFISHMSYECLLNHTNNHSKEKPKSKKMRYPLPLIIRQSNNRIHNQSGVFLAYSLNANPSFDKEPYNYLALNDLQELYNDFRDSKNAERKTFLYSINIESFSAENLRRDLRTLNISEGKYYPDIANILKEAMMEHKEKLNNS